MPLATGSRESVLVTVRSGCSGVGVGVIVGVLVGVAVAVFVGVAVAVLVGVFVGVDVKVGVAVGVLVGVDVNVGVAVAVFVGVGVAVAVFVAVAVGVAVDGSAVGVLVLVGVLVAVGDTNVSEPPVLVKDSGELAVSVSETLESANADVPSETVEKVMAVRIPAPFGPAGTPVVEQLNVTLFAPVVGAGQFTLRPVEPRKVSLVALTKDRTPASQVNVKP